MNKRTFEWRDLPALTELMSAVRTSSGDVRPITAASIQEQLGIPGLAPQENCLLFEDGDRLLAYALVHPEPPIGRSVLEMGVHPHGASTGLEREVVRTAIQHARELGADVLHVCLPQDSDSKDLLEAEGFKIVRVYWLMEWRGESVPGSQIPEGFVIRTFRDGDADLLARAQNAAFEGSWGFSPNTAEQIEYRASMSISPWEGIIFLSHGGDLAGYCWTCVDDAPGGGIGVIGMIGIVPDYRGRGLSKPVMLAGMESLKARHADYIKLDVDGNNTPAISLYRSVGFEKAAELHWFEVRLSGN